MNKTSSLLKYLHIVYKDIAIYEQALTHPSYNGDVNTKHQGCQIRDHSLR